MISMRRFNFELKVYKLSKVSKEFISFLRNYIQSQVSDLASASASRTIQPLKTRLTRVIFSPEQQGTSMLSPEISYSKRPVIKIPIKLSSIQSETLPILVSLSLEILEAVSEVSPKMAAVIAFGKIDGEIVIMPEIGQNLITIAIRKQCVGETGFYVSQKEWFSQPEVLVPYQGQSIVIIPRKIILESRLMINKLLKNRTDSIESLSVSEVEAKDDRKTQKDSEQTV